MNKRLLKLTVIPALVLTLVIQLSSCGTMLHPERRGQTGGRIDPSIAILDGIGLLFFIVPGLIAYAVDFSTGAIYLPGGHGEAPNGDSETDFLVIQSSPGGPTDAELEVILAKHTGETVDVNDPAVQSVPLDDPAEISSKYNKLIASGVIPSR